MFEIHEDDDGMGWNKGGVTPVHIPSVSGILRW